MKIIYYNGERADGIINRASGVKRDVEKQVTEIIDAVRERGDEAVLEYCERFDGVRPERLMVAPDEIDAAFDKVAPELISTMRTAAANIERFHAKQKREGFIDAPREGVIVGQRVLPVASVGLYVPGGTARYPSSVLMDAIPARLAGVERIVMTTPPDAEGNVPAAILAAAKIAGVTDIIKLGGAQAIAALAYGTESVPKTDKIVGPGNIYVATAKQLCQARGIVDVDMVAGPSEIMIIADGKSEPAHVAADLLSQAEHDMLSSAWLITTDAELAERTLNEVEAQLAMLPREKIARKSIDDMGRMVVVDSLETAARLANEIAPEHLELCVEDPFGLLPLIRNAGSVFLGRWCPEPLGDYLAGPNHTLPTSGTARFSSPLGVDDFMKRSSFIYYTEDALRNAADDVIRFAESEGLNAHANAVAIRAKGSGGK